ncbi:hypothetical protein B0H17DRAFT_1193438 [Mycena rosella]|uniref:DUF6818 domain-containing protein n=1 Tax=Mycena rosella TaxID=1033263 RepID=A0AAD7M7T7_MYCRO|nr:hypothetical protein B0H17DRAFT_1193438 [Mycena rosella]
MMGGPAQPAVQPMYNYPHVSLSHAIPDHLIDPALLPLLTGNDHDLTVPAMIGKKHHYSSSSSSDKDSNGSKDRKAPAAKHGHPQGSSNFTKDETNKLLDLVEELPLGPKGWKTIYKEHSKWSRKHGCPEHGGQSLETKYKQLVKAKKPTSDGVCPPEVKRAHHIESLINEHGTCNLNDSDCAANISSDDNDSIEALDSSAVTRTAVAHHNPSPPLHCTCMNAPALVDKLLQAFDPAALKACDDE